MARRAARLTAPSSLEAEILERLDQLVRITALQVAADQSMTERARLLKLAGLDNATIATVLKTSPQVIRTLTSNLYRRPTTQPRQPAGRRRRG
jgi:DNA-binding CsgD family transcriptional regulator